MSYIVHHCVACKLCSLAPICGKCSATLSKTLINEPIKISSSPEYGVQIQRIVQL